MPDRGATGVLYQISPPARLSRWWPWPWEGGGVLSAQPQHVARPYSRAAWLCRCERHLACAPRASRLSPCHASGGAAAGATDLCSRGGTPPAHGDVLRPGGIDEAGITTRPRRLA